MNSDSEYTACDEEKPLSQQELRDILDDQLEWEYNEYHYGRWDMSDDVYERYHDERIIDDYPPPTLRECLSNGWWRFKHWLRSLPERSYWVLQNRIWKDNYFRDWMNTTSPYDDIPF